jgi:hypothetical protein
MDWTSSRESGGLSHTSGVTSALRVMIGTASLRTAPTASPRNASRRPRIDQHYSSWAPYDLVCQDVESRLDDIVLVEVGSVGTRVPPPLQAWRAWSSQFSNGVVKMCLHMNWTRSGSSCSKQEKMDPLVWQTGVSGFVDSDGSQGRRCHSTRELLLWPSDIWMEDRQESRQPWRLGRRLRDLIEEKQKGNKN